MNREIKIVDKHVENAQLTLWARSWTWTKRFAVFTGAPLCGKPGSNCCFSAVYFG